MQIHVVNLDRHPERWETFRHRNAALLTGSGVNLTRFSAVDGAGVDRAALADAGDLIEPCTRTDGALGCALSHVALWRHAVRSGETITVLEDDTVLTGDFATAAVGVLAAVPGWELVMWGWNFDRWLWAEVPEGVGPCWLEFDETTMRDNLAAFPADRHPRAAVRLRHCFGTHAYSITPAGAQRMLDACLPMTDRLVRFFDGSVYAATSVDTDMNTAYRALRAYACLPPLALAENHTESSSTR